MYAMLHVARKQWSELSICFGGETVQREFKKMEYKLYKRRNSYLIKKI